MNTDREAYHNRHECLTEMAYDTPGMLPVRYVFVLTTRCNLSCSFCFQNRAPLGATMSTSRWKALIDQLPDGSRVTITGGEPLLFDGFREVFAAVVSRFDCNVITNGLLLNDAWIDFLLACNRFRVLSVSVDNIGNTIRGVGGNRWKQVEAMLRYFIERRDAVHPDCILDIKTTVLDETADDLFNIHRYCMETLRCDTHGFQFLKGSPIQHADRMVGFEEITLRRDGPVYSKFRTIVDQLEAVRRYNVETGHSAFLHPKVASLNGDRSISSLEILNRSFHVGKDFQPCKYPWSSVHINPDGELFPCLSVSMGNVGRSPLRDIIEGDRFERFRHLIRMEGSVEACHRCGWLKPKAD